MNSIESNPICFGGDKKITHYELKVYKKELCIQYGKNIYNKEYWDKYLTWTKKNL
jgi:hypothetical protein